MKQQEKISGVEILICPPFTALAAAAAALDGSGIKLGAQNMFWEEQGAYTGEISPAMLKEFGVSHVIIGHSERRHILGEDDAAVRRKLETALNHGFTPLLCIGEREEERNRGETSDVLERQLRAALEGLNPGVLKDLVVAYEPVWAIGTGRAASPTDADSAAGLVRQVVEKLLAGESASARGYNMAAASMQAISAALPLFPPSAEPWSRGASLEVDSFTALILAAKEAAGC